METSRRACSGGASESLAHIQCRCPALKDARIRAHHNLAAKLRGCLAQAPSRWEIHREVSVASLSWVEAPQDCRDTWPHTCDELAESDLEAQRTLPNSAPGCSANVLMPLPSARVGGSEREGGRGREGETVPFSLVCVCPSLPVIRPIIWACELQYVQARRPQQRPTTAQHFTRPIIWACELQYVQHPTAPVDRPCVGSFPTDARSEGNIRDGENQIFLA